MNLESEYINLEELKQEDILKVLKEQKRLVESNFSNFKNYLTKYDNKDKLFIDVLQTYISADTEYKNKFRIYETKHKNNSLLHSMDNSKIKEDEFYEILEVLYWEQLIKPLSSDLLLLSKDQTAKNHFQRLKIERNLKNIYQEYPELFSNESLGGSIKIDEKFKEAEIEDGSIKGDFTTLEQQQEIECKKNLGIFVMYGQTLNLILSPNALTSLTSLGLAILNTNSLNESTKHIQEQKKTIKHIKELKKEQAFISDDMNKKVGDFYKNITTILSLLMAAFSFIGVNLSAIPKIEENFTINIITLNASLILVLSIMFYFLNSVIGQNKITNKIGISSIIIFSLIFIIVGFIFGGVINKSNEEKVEEHIKNISNDNILIEKIEYEKINEEINILKQKISELENETPNSD